MFLHLIFPLVVPDLVEIIVGARLRNPCVEIANETLATDHGEYVQDVQNHYTQQTVWKVLPARF